MDTKYIHPIHSHFPFPCAHPPPTGTHLQRGLIFPSCPSFFKITCILIVQGGFTLVLQVCVDHALIKFDPSPPLLTHSLSSCSPNIQQLTAQYIMLHSYIDGWFHYFLVNLVKLDWEPPGYLHQVLCKRNTK
jgi:hypothetical protein